LKAPLTILFVTLFLQGFAYRDIAFSLNRKNIHFKIQSGEYDRELYNKFKILLELSDKLVEQTNQNDLPIYLFFDSNSFNDGLTYSTIAYGKFEYKDFKQKPSKIYNDKGLKINIRDVDFNIKETLNLIESSLHNLDFIKDNLCTYTFKPYYGDNIKLKSIPNDIVESFKKQTSTTVSEIIALKTLPKEIDTLKKVYHRDFDYYYQNDTFHFFSLKVPNIEWNEEQESYMESKYGKYLFSTPTVTEIVGENDIDSFVFLNDSMFYYYQDKRNKVFGPLLIDGLERGRMNILKHTIENEPIKRITFYFNGDDDVIFFPDSLVAISNFREREKDFILGLSSINKVVKELKPKSKLTQILIGFLLISLVINIILIIRKGFKLKL